MSESQTIWLGHKKEALKTGFDQRVLLWRMKREHIIVSEIEIKLKEGVITVLDAFINKVSA